MTQRIWLLEFDAKDISGGTVETFYYGTHGLEPFAGSDADRPNQWYEPRIIDPANLSKYLFSRGKVSGKSKVNAGVIELANADGGLDFLLDYGLDGRELTLRTGFAGDDFADFDVVLHGTMDAPAFVWSGNNSRLQLRIRDRQTIIYDTPIQTDRFAGTNSGTSGVEGLPDDIKGNIKPLCYGLCYNVPAVCVNSAAYIYSVHDGSVNAVSAVYDKGAALTFAADYATLSALQGASVPAGQYATCLAEGYFKLGSAPSGLITADIQGDNSSSSYVYKAADICSRILTDKAGLSASDLDSSAFSALNSANSAAVGVFINKDRKVGDVIDDLMNSIGAWWLTDNAGKVTCGRLEAPSGTPDFEWTRADIIEIERIAHNLPNHEINLTYKKCWKVQDEDALAAAVSAARRAFVSLEARTATTSSATVLSNHPLSESLTRETLLTTETDAATEASRLLTLFGAARQMLRLTVPLIKAAEVRPGQVHRLTISRFGMDSGKDFIVTGIDIGESGKDTITIELWG